ncbi:MFS transporter [Streptomyces sp. NPDC012888]|uniref:MFS transporter n=1 Tax=Streptomyces sp. NPDC012888 TaxID=3364855 RepID=UPI003677175D
MTAAPTTDGRGGRDGRNGRNGRDGRFARVLAAAALSNVGDGIRLVALPLLAAATTRDPFAVSALTAVSFLPWFLFGLPIGALVDRSRPERFMTWANTARTVLLAVLALALLADVRSMALLYVLAFLLGIGEAAYDNAAQSLVPRVVPDAQLEKANSALVTAERVGQDLAGPALGGVLFALSPALPFGLNAVTMAVGVLLLARVRATGPCAAAPGTGAATDTGADPGPGTARTRIVRTVAADAVAGMRWLWRARHVRTIVLTGSALTFFTMAWEATLVLLALGPMGVSETGYGVMLAAGAIGGVAGAMVTPVLTRRFDRRRLQIASLATTAVLVLALAAFPHPALAALAWGGTGAAFAVWNVLSVTLRQRLVPAELLGRVNSANRTFSMAAVPLGALTGGLVADAFGLRAPLWLSAVALTAVTLAYAVLSRAGAAGGAAAEADRVAEPR